MVIRRSIPARLLGLSLFVPMLLLAADEAAVRNDIQAIYNNTIRGQLNAKTPDDLAANERLIDTPDWVSVVNDGPPQRWKDLQAGLIAALGHFPADFVTKIEKLTLFGDRAVVIARVGALKDVTGDGDRSRSVLIRDTWVKTKAGWRRTMHEKPAPGKLDAELM